MKAKMLNWIKQFQTKSCGICILGWLVAMIFSGVSPYKLILVSGLMIASIMDLVSGYISNKFIATFFILGLSSIVYHTPVGDIRKSFLQIIIVFIVIFLLKILVKNHIGLGDVLVLTAISAFGDLIFFLRVLFLSFTIAGLTGVLLLLAKRTKLKTQIKFVPFILFGAISTFFIS